MHRFVLAEFNTHRVFSRNSASSRAIPLRKQLERVTDDPAIPLIWAAEQKGMQGGDEIEQTDRAEYFWLKARDRALDNAKNLADFGVHKSLVNRLLEPFMWHTVIVTATAWNNFFNLRCSPLAMPEIRDVAEMMKFLYDHNDPAKVEDWDWHLPLIDDEDREWAAMKNPDRVLGESALPTLVKISAARCARVSYLTHDGKRDYSEDLRLYQTLVDNMHSSPLEHVATPAAHNVQSVCIERKIRTIEEGYNYCIVVPKYGNFLGWHQHRFDVEAAKQYQAFS